MAANESIDEFGNKIFNLKQRKEGQIEVHFVRASSDKNDLCFMCKVMTPRVITHKLSSDTIWNLLYICDFCLDGIQKMKCDFFGV